MNVNTKGVLTVLSETYDQGRFLPSVYSHQGVHMIYLAVRLVVTDLNPAGTRLIHDSGEGARYSLSLNAYDGAWYFNDGGTDLYRYENGSEQAAVVYSVPDAGRDYGYYSDFTRAEGGLLFVAKHNFDERIMRIAPGTDTVSAVTYGAEAQQLQAYSSSAVRRSQQGGKLLLWTDQTPGQVLAVTDGTQAGTKLLEGTEFQLSKNFSMYETEEGDILYLARSNQYDKSILRRYDARTGTNDVVDMSMDYLPQFYGIGVETEEAIVFYSNDQGELHKYDKRTKSYLKYSDIHYGDRDLLVTEAGYLIVRQTTGPYRDQVMSLDLSREEFTKPVVLSEDYVFAELFDLKGESYFVASRKGTGAFLYRTDGTVAGTEAVYPLFTRNGDAEVSALIAGEDSLYVLENDRYHALRGNNLRTTSFAPGDSAPIQYLGTVLGTPVFTDYDRLMVPGVRSAPHLRFGSQISAPIVVNNNVFWTYLNGSRQGGAVTLSRLERGQTFSADVLTFRYDEQDDGDYPPAHRGPAYARFPRWGAAVHRVRCSARATVFPRWSKHGTYQAPYGSPGGGLRGRALLHVSRRGGRPGAAPLPAGRYHRTVRTSVRR